MGRIKLCASILATIVIAGGLAGAPAHGSTAQGGTELWTGRYSPPGLDVAEALAASPDGSKVFVTGSSQGAGNPNDYATTAYDAATGVALWTTRYNGPGNDYDYAYAIGNSPDGSKVLVTGTSRDALGDFDYATIAYDSSSGSVLWVRRYEGPGGGPDYANALTTSPDGSKVFVTGYSYGGASGHDYATISYDAASGAVLWARRFNGPGNADDIALSVAAGAHGSEVFVTGSSYGGTSGFDYATIAYDASTGAVRWSKRSNGSGNGDDSANSVAASPDGSAVFVTGQSAGAASESDYATIAYDASTGAVLWGRRYSGPGSSFDSASSVAASPNGSAVFVTGQSSGATSESDYATIAYDVSTGEVLWARRFNGPDDPGDFATSLAPSADGSVVFVTGSSYGSSDSDYATIAYDASTGAVHWARGYNGPANENDFASAVAASPDGSKVFVTGTSNTTDPDYATVAYEA